MSIETKSITVTVKDSRGTAEIARLIASTIDGGACVELVGDVGAGKTTFTQSLVSALGSEDNVTSPTFTLENVYHSNDYVIHHFDLYRLQEVGLLPEEVNEALSESNAIVIIEWADLLKKNNSLPNDRLIILFEAEKSSETARKITITAPDDYKLPRFDLVSGLVV